MARHAEGQQRRPQLVRQGINEVIKGLERVAAYVDDVIFYDTDPTAHTANIRALFQRARLHNLKLSAAKDRIGATKDDFLGYTISPAGVNPTPTRSLP